MLRLVQLAHPREGRRVAIIDEPVLRLVTQELASVYDLARVAIELRRRLEEVARNNLAADEPIPYDNVYLGRSEYALLPPFDHPKEPARCLVMGTGLTHRASAESRQSMHLHTADQVEAPVTDSMRMYRIGLEGGRPAPGQIGAQPEWFYKGYGTILRAHGQPLDVPNFAGDGGDEAEIAGCYVIGADGTPWRVGLVQGNEFSDHVGEARNYLYLAESKLRTCSIGPELVVPGDDLFFAGEVRGRVTVERAGRAVWQGKLASGERWMCHTLANLEHHHFRNEFHRRPGDAHVHFLGADEFSFRDKIRLEDGDEMVIAFDGFGRPLRNPVRVDQSEERAVTVKAL